jgi:hypothetical protein
MNIIKTTGIGIAIIMLCTLCTKYPKDYEPGINHNFRYLNIMAEVSETEIPIHIADNCELCLLGTVGSCNLSSPGELCISVDGIITHLSPFGRFDFEGELLLESDDILTDCKLWGAIEGKGTVSGNSFLIESDVEVNYGTGTFLSKSGQLTLTIKGTLPTEDNPAPKYELNLDGNLNYN